MEGPAPSGPRAQNWPRRSGALQFMKLSFAGERILAVMAHPDDAELLCAGTLARAKSDGAAIGICIMCDGSKGFSSAEPDPTSIAQLRRGEAASAALVLGAELYSLEGPDAELFDTFATRRA